MSKPKKNQRRNPVAARNTAAVAGYTLELMPPAMPFHPDLHHPLYGGPPPRREVLDEEAPPEGTPEYERWQQEWSDAIMWGMAKYGHGDENDDEPWDVPPADDGSQFWGARYRYLLKPFTGDGPEGQGD